MSHSSGCYGGGTAQVGRLYVAPPVFIAVRGRNQSQFYLEDTKKKSNPELEKENVLTYDR